MDGSSAGGNSRASDDDGGVGVGVGGGDVDGDDGHGDDDGDYGGDGTPTFVHLAVPPGAEPGVDSLSFVYGGVGMEVTVPPGSVAGDVLRIRVGATGGGGDGATGGESAGPPSSSSGLMDELGGMNDVDDDDDAPGAADRSSGAADRSRGNAAADSAREGGGEGITVIELGGAGRPTSATLRLVESLPGAGANDDNDDGRGGKEDDGTHGAVWASGRLLAQALTSSVGLRFLGGLLFASSDGAEGDGDCGPFHCLELGSGSGVCGLALAHALTRVDVVVESKNDAAAEDDDNNVVAARILLTDRGEDAVNLLEENMSRNPPPSPIGDGSGRRRRSVDLAVDAAALTWGEEEELFSTTKTTTPNKHVGGGRGSGEKKKFRLVLGSDLLYNTRESYDPLVRTIKERLDPERGVVLLAVRWRKPDLEREFFRRAESQGLRFELWKEFEEEEEEDKGRMGRRRRQRRPPRTLGWREYGDPGCEESNGHFRETLVSVAKREKPLAMIGEEDMEAMNDEEYSAFEELQVQIYVGKYHAGEDLISRKRQRIDDR